MNPLHLVQQLPSALQQINTIYNQIKDFHLFVFLDYDGTLTPIVADPAAAQLSADARSTICDLAKKYRVAIISGRDVTDLQHRVAIKEIYYSGSHGFDICGPNGLKMEIPQAKTFFSEFDEVEQILGQELKIKGVTIEKKRFAVAVHYRNVDLDQQEFLIAQVKKIGETYKNLKLTYGKKVIELRPNIDWNKGKAALWLLTNTKVNNENLFAIYIGDDLTDEDAFRQLTNHSIGILVRDKESNLQTAANYVLDSPQEVIAFLRKLIEKKIPLKIS